MAWPKKAWLEDNSLVLFATVCAECFLSLTSLNPHRGLTRQLLYFTDKVRLAQRFSVSRAVPAPGDEAQQCLGTSVAVTLWGGGSWHPVGGAREAAPHPPVPGTAPQRMTGPGVSSTERERLDWIHVSQCVWSFARSLILD